jgi:hypothetical protein
MISSSPAALNEEPASRVEVEYWIISSARRKRENIGDTSSFGMLILFMLLVFRLLFLILSAQVGGTEVKHLSEKRPI